MRTLHDVTGSDPIQEQPGMTNLQPTTGSIGWRVILVGGLAFLIVMLTIALRRE